MRNKKTDVEEDVIKTDEKGIPDGILEDEKDCWTLRKLLNEHPEYLDLPIVVDGHKGYTYANKDLECIFLGEDLEGSSIDILIFSSQRIS